MRMVVESVQQTENRIRQFLVFMSGEKDGLREREEMCLIAKLTFLGPLLAAILPIVLLAEVGFDVEEVPNFLKNLLVFLIVFPKLNFPLSSSRPPPPPVSFVVPLFLLGLLLLVPPTDEEEKSKPKELIKLVVEWFPILSFSNPVPIIPCPCR